MLLRLRYAVLLVSFALFLSPHAHARVPTITRPVTDKAYALSLAEEAAITEKLVALRERTGAQMAVLVVYSLYGTPIDDYAQEVFTVWGGGSSERDDGLLLVLATKDRENRLHLGYGIEPMIGDWTASTMLGEMREDLRAERYGPAIARLIDAVAHRIEDERAPKSSFERATSSVGRFCAHAEVCHPALGPRCVAVYTYNHIRAFSRVALIRYGLYFLCCAVLLLFTPLNASFLYVCPLMLIGMGMVVLVTGSNFSDYSGSSSGSYSSSGALAAEAQAPDGKRTQSRQTDACSLTVRLPADGLRTCVRGPRRCARRHLARHR